MRKKNVTISDIAEKTGYSKTTVSFAFNWPDRISDSTVQKILECANEMGYHGSSEYPDKTNRFRTVCMLVNVPAEPGVVPDWGRASYAVYKECEQNGIMLSLISQNFMDDVFFARSSAVDAFMLFSIEPTAYFRDVTRKRGIPVISVNLDGESEEKRIENSVDCAKMLIDLIREAHDVYAAPEDSYIFFAENR